jgi:ubiquinone/menaquinone biosynthesis C-methylase UbiE
MEIYRSQADQPILDWQWLEPCLRNINAIILQYLPSGSGKALDVGCGTGRVAFQLAANGFQVHAVDVEPRVIELAKRIAAARNEKNCDFRVCDFRDQNAVTPEDYDLVVCSEVLEHVVDYEHIHEMIYRSVKPGGRVIITVPYGPNQFSVLDTYNGHVRRFSYDQVMNDLRPYRSKKIIITGFPFYRMLCRAYLLKLRLTGGQHSNEELWMRPFTRTIARLIYPFCRFDNFLAFTRLGTNLIAIAEK